MSSPLNLPYIRAAARAARAAGLSRTASSLGQPARCFSTSPSNYVRVTFGETSNDALRETFAEIQEKFILPAHLPKEQRAILHDAKKKTFLQQNPVVIEIEGLEQKYTTPIRKQDLRNSKAIFKQAARSMSTPEDFANVETLLAGFKKAGIVLKHLHFAMVTARALEHDCLKYLIDCARHVEDTGYLLTVQKSGFIILRYIADYAKSKGQGQAVKSLEQIMDILERPPHSKVHGVHDLRTSRLARGMMLATRLGDIESSETPSTAQLNALNDEAQVLRALWTKALQDTSGSTELDIDQLYLNPFTREERVLKTFDESEVKRALRNTRDVFTLSEVVRMFAHNIRALEATPAVLSQSCEPFADAGKHLDEYLTQIITRVAAEKEIVAAQLPKMAREYKRRVGRAPTWAEPLAEDAVVEGSEKA